MRRRCNSLQACVNRQWRGALIRSTPPPFRRLAMKTLSAALLTLGGVLAVVSTSHADARPTRDPGVNQRQHHQRERIQQGVRSGELTRRETRKLVEEQRDVR